MAKAIFLGCVWVACGLACLGTHSVEPLWTAVGVSVITVMFTE